MSTTDPHDEPERDETAPSDQTAPRDEKPTDEVEADEPVDEVEIEDVVDPTTVRRAPRYKAFFQAGTYVGIVLGATFATYLLLQDEAEGLLKPGVYFTVITLSVTTVTVLLAGFLAILADRRSLRRRGR
ncbi:hypothetical protein CLV28_0832 [Sediminihabitans luteus]|uniref:Uncharacterized protein n=1 Tax=Sediminihabitans luteus TaxID=1138585 RepID=A0A2M9D0D7_9CELL|nr:hypothetical protein [Sediminihabitans luteus]PJJ77607.1 hypothetical protein CLV28_0832 [Sediminihabitans luteus]GII98507.1 hypothetical protein Slu03_08850 [Sediminihabitans luteus]